MRAVQEEAAYTVLVSLAALPVPPLVEVIVLVVLAFTPAVVPVTSTFTVQVPEAAIELPLTVNVVSVAAGAKVPPHVLLAFGVPATCKPVGSASVKATPVNAVLAFGFVIVKVSVVVPANGIVAAPNALVIVGGANTVKVAFAVPPVNATGPVAVTAVVVFNAAPTVLLVTFACN